MKYFKITVILLFILSIISCENKPNEKEDLLRYKIVDEKIIDSPAKTQILTTIVLDLNDSITKDRLETLLNHLYDQRMNRTDFEYRENPNSVAVYAFKNEEKAKAGIGQWIAMISKMPIEKKFEISFSQSGLNSLKEKEEHKWNLSFKTRKEIWDKIIYAERYSQSEGEKKYPIVAGTTKEDAMKSGKLSAKLKAEMEEKIIKEYKIDKATLDSISLEGLSHDWSFPERKLN